MPQNEAIEAHNLNVPQSGAQSGAQSGSNASMNRGNQTKRKEMNVFLLNNIFSG